MTTNAFFFKSLSASAIAAAAWMILPGAASANGCPSNTVWNGYQCIAPPGGGEAGSTNTNNNTNENWNGNQNTNWNGQGQQQGQGQHQGQTANGGNASSNSSAVSGSNSSATTGNQSTSVNAGGGKGGDAHASGGSVSGSGNSSSNVKGSGNSRVTNNVDASNRSSYKAAANGVVLGPAVIGGSACHVGGGLGGSTIGRTFGGNFGVIDKACATAAHTQSERAFICANFGPNSNECASATYHSGGLAAMAMVESGRVRERGVERVGIVPASRPQKEGSIVKAWTDSQKRPATQQAIRCPSTHPRLAKVNGELRCYR